MNLDINFFSEGSPEYWEFAKKKNKEGKGTGILLLPLRPFRSFLIKALLQHGVPVKTSGHGLKRKVTLEGKKLLFGPLVYLFAKHVMKNQPYSKQAASNYMEAFDFYEYNHLSDKTRQAGGELVKGAAGAAAGLIPGGGLALGLTSGLVKAIIDFIKGLRDKKKRGEKLSPQEEKLADLYDKTEGEINKTAQDLAEEKVGEQVLSPKTWLLLAAALVVVVVIARK